MVTLSGATAHEVHMGQHLQYNRLSVAAVPANARTQSARRRPGPGESRQFYSERPESDPFAFAAPFEALLLRAPAELTTDEKAACASLIEVMDQTCGRGSPTLRRWARLGNEVWFLARTLGRMPRPEDEGAEPRHFRWMTDQRRERLNSFEQAFVESMPGWAYPE